MIQTFDLPHSITMSKKFSCSYTLSHRANDDNNNNVNKLTALTCEIIIIIIIIITIMLTDLQH